MFPKASPSNGRRLGQIESHASFWFAFILRFCCCCCCCWSLKFREIYGFMRLVWTWEPACELSSWPCSQNKTLANAYQENFRSHKIFYLQKCGPEFCSCSKFCMGRGKCNTKYTCQHQYLFLYPYTIRQSVIPVTIHKLSMQQRDNTVVSLF